MSQPAPLPDPADPPAIPPLAQVTIVSPMFKLVFLGVFSLTLILLIGHIATAVMLNNPSDAEKDLVQNLRTGWFMGFSAMAGLVGGKSMT